jgi:DNA-directed RNA polymerase specialized sigma24 family protein
MVRPARCSKGTGLDRRPTEGPATSPDRDDTLDTACRCYLAHEAQMVASARRHLRLAGLDHEDPEDVWRDVQLKILDQIDAGRRIVAEAGDTHEDAHLKYAHAVLKLHVNDVRKKAIRRRTDSTGQLDDEAATADVWQQTAHRLVLADWRQALVAKSERTRKVLLMSELGYSRQEIADALGVSVKRVGKLQEQGKPVRERILASRGATKLQEICGGIAARLPLPAGVSTIVAKTAVGGGIAAIVGIGALGGITGVQSVVQHHEKRPTAAPEQAHIKPPTRTATTPRVAHTATSTSPQTPRTTTTKPKSHTVSRTTTRRHKPAAPPARATQAAPTTGTLCATQQICTPVTTQRAHTGTTSTTPSAAPPSAPTPSRPPAAAAAPSNLCVLQGLCR